MRVSWLAGASWSCAFHAAILIGLFLILTDGESHIGNFGYLLLVPLLVGPIMLAFGFAKIVHHFVNNFSLPALVALGFMVISFALALRWVAGFWVWQASLALLIIPAISWAMTILVIMITTEYSRRKGAA